jgi:hypothetical protein
MEKDEQTPATLVPRGLEPSEWNNIHHTPPHVRAAPAPVRQAPRHLLFSVNSSQDRILRIVYADLGWAPRSRRRHGSSSGASTHH